MPGLLRIMGCPNSAHFDGTLAPVEEPSTASQPDSSRSRRPAAPFANGLASSRAHSTPLRLNSAALPAAFADFEKAREVTVTPAEMRGRPNPTPGHNSRPGAAAKI